MYLEYNSMAVQIGEMIGEGIFFGITIGMFIAYIRAIL